VIQNPPRRAPNLAAILILGFVVGIVAEFAMDMFVSYVVKPTSLSKVDAINVVLSLVLGAIVGGVMFFGRPRHYGVTAIAAVTALVAGFIGDEIFTPVYFALHHVPVHAELFTAYFTHARTSFWISNLLLVAMTAGLTAVRVLRVRAREGQGGGMPQQTWPAQQMPPGGQWGAPPPYGPPQGQAPYGPPQGQAPYGPPPGQAPYGPPQGQAPYGPPPGPYGPPQGPYDPPPQGGTPPA
jgi:riboflavin transporter FmnP